MQGIDLIRSGANSVGENAVVRRETVSIHLSLPYRFCIENQIINS